MATLIIPPVVTIRDLVVALAPVVAPDANYAELQRSIFLVQRLVFLCNIAQSNKTAARFFEEVMQRMVLPASRTPVVDD